MKIRTTKNNDGQMLPPAVAFDESTKALKRHLEQGADPSAERDNGSTPMHWAAENGNAETRSLLLEHGADVNAKDKGRLARARVVLKMLFERRGKKEITEQEDEILKETQQILDETRRLNSDTRQMREKLRQLFPGSEGQANQGEEAAKNAELERKGE